MTGVDVGSISARLDAIFNEAGFDQFDKRYEKAQVEAAKKVTAKLGADYDPRAVDAYTAALLRAKAQASRRDEFKARLGADFDETAFREFERRLTDTRAKASRRIDAKLGADFDRRGIVAYNLALDRAEARVRRRDALKAHLGADFNEDAFRSFENALDNTTAAGKRADDVFGGGGGLRASIGSLGGAIGPLSAGAAALAPILVALGGAATALASSLAAAAAGAGAIGVGLAAALGPIAAVAGAVLQRVSVLQQAYKALGDQQQKGADQSKQTAAAQQGAADRVKGAEQGLADAQIGVQRAQENLTDARFRARRELEDLADAADRSAISEQRASVALKEAIKRAAEVEADPTSTGLDVQDARVAVKEAQQGLKDARIERARAQTDAARGTNTVRQAEQQLADARRASARAADQVRAANDASTAATDKQGAAATTAQEKLAQLSSTERTLLGTVRTTVDAFHKTFQPATDAIFGGVNTALEKLTPVMETFKGRLGAIGTAIGDTIARAAGSLTGPEWTKAFDSFTATAGKLVKPISDALGSVAVIFRNIAVAAQPYVIQFIKGIASALGGIADKTKDAGAVRGVIRDLVSNTKEWLHFIEAVGHLLLEVFTGGKDQGRDLLKSITKIVEKWADFLGTAKGQREMRQFFKDAIQVTKDLFTALITVTSGFAKMVLLADHLAAAFGRFRDSPVGKVLSTILGYALKLDLPFRTLILLAPKLPDAFTSAFKAVADTILGFVTTSLGAIEKLVDVGSKLPFVGGKFKGLRNDIQDARDGIDHMRESLRGVDHDAGNVDLGQVRKENRDSAKTFRDLASDGKASMSDIRKAVDTNGQRIASDLGKNTAEGKAALAHNFALAMDAVERQMHRGAISTRDGLREIRGYLTDELQVYGLSLRQARNIAKTGDISGKTGGNEQPGQSGRTYAKGGWIGAPGQVGRDSVAMDAAVGGSILNRHQIPFADLALAGRGGLRSLLTRARSTAGPTTRVVAAPGELHLDPGQTTELDGALRRAGMGGLDRLFSRVRTPHYMAGGGYPLVSGDTDFVPALGRALSAMARATRTPISVTSGRRTLAEQAALVREKGLYGPGNPTGAAAPSANAPHVRGIAGDIVPGRDRFGAIAAKFGLGFTVPTEPWHIQLLNAVGNLAAAAGTTISRVRVQGGGGIGDAVQRVLDVARGGAQRLADTASASSTGTGEAPAVSAPATGSDAATMRAISSEYGWNFNDWWGVDAIETGHGANLVNPTSTARLRGQFLSSNWGKYGPGSDPRANPSMREQIVSMARYILERYKNPTAALAHEHQYGWYASGGRIGGSFRSIDPEGARSLNAHYNTPRIAAFDAITGSEGTVARLDRKYQQADRRFNLTDEVLIDQTTGAVNEDAVKHRAGELLALEKLRDQIVAELEKARTIARRVIKTFQTIIRRLTRALPHARTKNQHTKLVAAIASYQGQLDDWRDNKLPDLQLDIGDAQLDSAEIGKEYAEVIGTQPQPQDTTTTDTTGTADTGTTDLAAPTADATAPPSAADIARAAFAQITAFNAARADAFAQFGSNYTTGYTRPDTTTLAAGERYYGATGAAASADAGAIGAAGVAGGEQMGAAGRGPTIVIQPGASFNQFQRPPDDPFSWSRQQAFELNAM